MARPKRPRRGRSRATRRQAGAPDQGSSGAGAAGAFDQDADDAGAAGAQDADGVAADLSRFLWGFDNDGGMAGIPASEARDMDYANWNSSDAAGDLEEVIVAVVDTGVDAANPDLAPVMWEASPELQQKIGGDKHGFAVGGDEEAGITSYTGMTSYHGTHVAGTIAAKWERAGRERPSRRTRASCRCAITTRSRG